MQFQDYLRILRRQLVIILAGAVIGLSVGALIAMLTPQRYQATTEVMVTVQVGETASPTERALATSYANQVVQTYRDIVTSSIVLDRVIDDLGLDVDRAELAASVDASTQLNSAILSIRVNDTNPGQAARVANGIADSFSAVVSDTLELREQETSYSIHIVTLQAAQVPTAPVAPNTQLMLVVGGIVGLAAGLAVALLRSLLDQRVRTAADVQAAVSVPLLGQIPLDPDTVDRPLAVSSAPQSARAEAYRSLRTNVRFLFENGKGVFVVTSSGPGEGKSTTAANLALAFADAGHRVALIDADLRLPRVAEYFGIEGGIGLSDVLAGRVRLNDVVQRWGRSSLFLLPAGTVPPNPAELLGSPAMQHLVDATSEAFDVVVIDAPPLLLVTDAAVIARVTTGALLIAAAGATQAGRLAAAAKSIEAVDARVLGTVLTKAPLGRREHTAQASYAAAAPR
ncbi:polysaccharide biosynthesis tyrosine autokinase [Microbacterium paraoxydans]|uniref:polysaccharide biosynthesis tyrosine autokinase n=1 Tax=Microbacterium paraoxydans TaxID=199592 RepID=UPI003D745BAC